MQNKEYFNNLAEKWDDMCCHPKEKIEHVIKTIGELKGKKILDIGSGTGVIIPYLERETGNTGSITAMDIAENMIKVSKRKNKYENLDFKVQDFITYESNKKYDCIVAYSCYPHFKDKEKFFKKAYELLNKNGKLVIAHVESKNEINSRHSEIKQNLESKMLESMDKLKSFSKKKGFDSSYTEDNDEFYIYIGKKI